MYRSQFVKNVHFWYDMDPDDKALIASCEYICHFMKLNFYITDSYSQAINTLFVSPHVIRTLESSCLGRPLSWCAQTPGFGWLSEIPGL